MSQDVKVRNLIFKADANNLDNIEGNPSNKKMVFSDDFTGKALDTGKWVAASNNGGTEAITAGTNGTVTLTTSTTTDDRSLLATPLIFLAAQNPIIEARFKLNTVTTAAVFFGFNHVTTEGNDALPMEITGTALVNAKATDAVGFIFDTDGSVDHWYVAATKNNAEGTPVAMRAEAWASNIQGALVQGDRVRLNAGTNTITIAGKGTHSIYLPPNTTGTATNGTGTFTGSPKALTAGDNTITNTVEGTLTVLVLPAPSTTYETLRIALDPSANATFYRNGVVVGYLAAATTAATSLCAFFGVLARTNSARILTVDYFKSWQDRN